MVYHAAGLLRPDRLIEIGAMFKSPVSQKDDTVTKVLLAKNPLPITAAFQRPKNPASSPQTIQQLLCSSLQICPARSIDLPLTQHDEKPPNHTENTSVISVHPTHALFKPRIIQRYARLGSCPLSFFPLLPIQNAVSNNNPPLLTFLQIQTSSCESTT